MPFNYHNIVPNKDKSYSQNMRQLTDPENTGMFLYCLLKEYFNCYSGKWGRVKLQFDYLVMTNLTCYSFLVILQLSKLIA